MNTTRSILENEHVLEIFMVNCLTSETTFIGKLNCIKFCYRSFLEKNNSILKSLELKFSNICQFCHQMSAIATVIVNNISNVAYI